MDEQQNTGRPLGEQSLEDRLAALLSMVRRAPHDRLVSWIEKDIPDVFRLMQELEAGAASLRSKVAALEEQNAQLTEALRSMVTVYIGVMKDHFDDGTYRRAFEEPPVKNARSLLGLDNPFASPTPREEADSNG